MINNYTKVQNYKTDVTLYQVFINYTRYFYKSCNVNLFILMTSVFKSPWNIDILLLTNS